MTIGPSVDFDKIASRTEGFSGADLQALMYNAHLDVIHSFIADAGAAPSDCPTSTNKVDEVPVKYTTIGAAKDKIILSRAEEMALQRRVSAHSICVGAFDVLLILLFCTASSNTTEFFGGKGKCQAGSSGSE